MWKAYKEHLKKKLRTLFEGVKQTLTYTLPTSLLLGSDHHYLQLMESSVYAEEVGQCGSN